MALGDGPSLSLGIDASGATRGAREFSDAIDKVQSAGRSAAGDINDLGNAIENVDAPASRAAAALSGMQAAFAGFAGGIAAGLVDQLAGAIKNVVSESIALTDRYQSLDARLGLVLDGTVSVTDAHRDLYQVAQQTGQSFEGTAALFQKLAMNSKELGLSYEQLTGLVATINQAMVVSGASASEASAGLQQLGQAFAGGVLRGDEFNSVMENTPRLAQAIAAGMDVSVGALRSMAEEGELSAEKVASAVQSQAVVISSEYEKMGGSVERSSQTIMNALGELSTSINENIGVNKALISVLDEVTKALESPAMHTAISTLVEGWSMMAQGAGLAVSAISTVIGAIQQFNKIADQGMLAQGIKAPESILRQLPSSESPRPVSSADFGPQLPADQMLKDWQSESTFRASQMPKPKPRYSGMVEGPETYAPKKRAAGGGGGAKGKSAEALAKEEESITDRILQSNLRAHDQQVALIEARRDDELQALEQVKMASEKKAMLAVKVEDTAAQQISAIRKKDSEEEQKKQDDALKALGRYEEANLQVHGRMTDMIIRQRDEEFRAINADKGMTDEQKAQARVLAEDTASQQIIEIRRREAAEIASLQEENLQTRASNAFGDERKQLQKRLLEMQRDSQLADIQASKMSDEMKAQASELKTDTFAQRIAVVDPTPWEAASRNLQEFGENLTSVDGMSQGVIQGIASIGSTAASAFADAIVSGESFADTLETLGKTLEKMLIQMTLQLAMQAALGAGASYLGAAMGPSAGTPYSPAEGGGVFGGTAATMAKGGIVQESAGLASGVYTSPTYFRTVEPTTRTTELVAATGKPNYSYDTAFARGGVPEKTERGLMGEAGAEAVLPLTKTETGQLGVSSRNDEGVSNVLPLRRMPTGQLGVTAAELLEPPGYDKALAEGGIIADKSGVANSIITRPTYFMVHEPRTYTISAENPTVNFTSPPTSGRHASALLPSLSYDRAFATGGVIESETANKIYTRPTYFPMKEPGLQTMARGRGLMGESGPEAVLPLTRTPTGQLGVSTSGEGGGGAVNITVNNNSKANVSTESSEDQNGNRNIIMTIADEVENIVAGRMLRSGTRVNRATSSIGQVVAR